MFSDVLKIRDILAIVVVFSSVSVEIFANLLFGCVLFSFCFFTLIEILEIIQMKQNVSITLQFCESNISTKRKFI